MQLSKYVEVEYGRKKNGLNRELYNNNNNNNPPIGFH